MPIHRQQEQLSITSEEREIQAHYYTTLNPEKE